jgi:hypothetical protein
MPDTAHLIPPDSFLLYPPHRRITSRITYGTLQYAIITPALALAAGFLNWGDLYAHSYIGII